MVAVQKHGKNIHAQITIRKELRAKDSQMQFALFTDFQTSFKTFFTFRSTSTSSAFEVV